jgi:hypothetical protein
MTKLNVKGESKLIQGHVLDVSRPHLLAALRRYDQQLYLKWNAKKRGGLGVWELRRKPEFKSVQESRWLDAPGKGKVFVKGDVFEFDGFTIVEPKYHETSFENHVKDFEVLTYQILDWVKAHDVWEMQNTGFKGKNFVNEAEYREAKYEEKIDEDSYAEKQYMIKQHRTDFNDLREYVLAGGNPARLVDYWGK